MGVPGFDFPQFLGPIETGAGIVSRLAKFTPSNVI